MGLPNEALVDSTKLPINGSHVSLFFDLIVTNARTTGAEGVALLRRLRMARPHTRLIILTERKVSGDVLNALRYHAFSFFSVPVATEHLRTLIEDAITEPVWDDGI